MDKCKCGSESEDMRYTILNNTFVPICPTCQQQEKVDKLERKLLKAKSKLNTLKLLTP